MKAIVPVLFLVALAIPRPGLAVGHAFSEAISVLAPDQRLADDVLALAEQSRREIAGTWLGNEDPPLQGRIAIHVQLSDTEDWGFTWPIDHPQRTLHRVWLKTSRNRALGTTLRHEVAHALCAAAFPDRLPAWAEEAIAGSYDDPERAAIRRYALVRMVQSGKWPDLQALLNASSLSPGDEISYATASSVAQYLLTRGDRTEFVRFAQAGKTDGWNRALQEHYGLASVAVLQRAWQLWTLRTMAADGPTARQISTR